MFGCDPLAEELLPHPGIEAAAVITAAVFKRSRRVRSISDELLSTDRRLGEGFLEWHSDILNSLIFLKIIKPIRNVSG